MAWFTLWTKELNPSPWPGPHRWLRSWTLAHLCGWSLPCHHDAPPWWSQHEAHLVWRGCPAWQTASIPLEHSAEGRPDLMVLPITCEFCLLLYSKKMVTKFSLDQRLLLILLYFYLFAPDSRAVLLGRRRGPNGRRAGEGLGGWFWGQFELWRVSWGKGKSRHPVESVRQISCRWSICWWRGRCGHCVVFL